MLMTLYLQRNVKDIKIIDLIFNLGLKLICQFELNEYHTSRKVKIMANDEQIKQHPNNEITKKKKLNI